jgi:hypothetical protein
LKVLRRRLIGGRALIVVASIATLFVAAPALAGGTKDKEKDPVPVSASGAGIAPRAPQWVREQIVKIHAGKIEDGGADAPARVAPQALRRLAWFGCRDVWAYRGYDHFLGYSLFRYYQQVSWCSNGYTIYSWSRFRWAELNGPGWAFDGHIDSYLGGSSTAKRAWTQGAFHACYFGWCDYKVPWVNIEVGVDGGWSANTGG